MRADPNVSSINRPLVFDARLSSPTTTRSHADVSFPIPSPFPSAPLHLDVSSKAAVGRDAKLSRMLVAAILEWIKALGPLVLGIAVFVATAWFQKWQLQLAKQKLRVDLYDRRFAVYCAFHELLLALPEKNKEEIQAALRKAQIAASGVPFLFDDSTIQAYLDDLLNEIAKEIISNITFLESVTKEGAMMADQKIAREVADRAARLGHMKLAIPGTHLQELPGQFAKFLNLTDFAKLPRRLRSKPTSR